MTTIIYHKSDLQCVGTVALNMGVEQEIALNVIPNFGGATEDYATIETDLRYFRLETINGEVVAVEDTHAPVTPEPTEADYLVDLDFRLSKLELGL